MARGERLQIGNWRARASCHLFPPGSLFVSRVHQSGPAACGCLFSRRRRGGSLEHTYIHTYTYIYIYIYIYIEEGRKRGALTCHGKWICVRPPRRVRGEILGWDIGPQATNSYVDIDSYTKSPGDVSPTRLSANTTPLWSFRSSYLQHNSSQGSQGGS